MSSSTHRANVFRKYGLPMGQSFSLEELAKITKVPLEALKEVEKRGRGAYANNLASVRLKGSFMKNPSAAIGRSGRLSINQWAFARVFSFLDKGKTYQTADADIAKKYGI
jgi:hypothetical protein